MPRKPETATPMMIMSRIKARYLNRPDQDTILNDLDQAFSLGHRFGIDRAADTVDRCNRESPYNAVGAASRIRSLQVATVQELPIIEKDFSAFPD